MGLHAQLASQERSYLVSWATGVVVACVWIAPLLAVPATLGLVAAFVVYVFPGAGVAGHRTNALRACIVGGTLTTHALLYMLHPFLGMLVAALAVAMVLLHALSGLVFLQSNTTPKACSPHQKEHSQTEFMCSCSAEC
jgi:hypothetical protein